MECVNARWWGPVTAVLLLHTLSWSRTGAIEPAPKIDGRHRSTITLQENITHRFKCHSDGWDSRAPPLLTWYLNGRRQNEPPSAKAGPEESRVVRRPGARSHHNSTFALHARRWDRELVCVAANPDTGESYNATVTLNVQFQPEILRVKAHYTETSDPSDLSLVLFALVRSNPPATITFVDQSGRMVANTSDFLVLDSRSYPWLANHTLKVTLSSLSGNVSMNASNSVGTAQSNLTLTEFLQSRVEVPMLGIVTGGSMAFMALLVLSLIVLYEPVEILMTKKSNSAALNTEKEEKVRLPRENMSLPSNMQLNDLCTLRRVREAAKRRSLGEERRRPDEADDDLIAAYAARGFSRCPMRDSQPSRLMPTMQRLLCLLFWITAAAAKLKVTNTSDGINIACKAGSLMIRGKNFTSKILYEDKSSGEYSCSGEKIFVKFRTCDNCVELDVGTMVGFVAGELAATVLIGVAVYLVTSLAHSPALTSDTKSSDRHQLIPSPNRGPNATYQVLHRNAPKDEYGVLANRR
ncbi:hypothetical protein NHX12_008860 [Muraenolepis orangiensis]|uniref:Ig-like domain-containing protein n=1 Tax=Muraenolepis orangiensis TaxID=630683 RepID=A0A9Q0DQQ4_9TELE|nr:hypothetical protein NHX12_008860 [Muraenolepis orangiensis]